MLATEVRSESLLAIESIDRQKALELKRIRRKGLRCPSHGLRYPDARSRLRIRPISGVVRCAHEPSKLTPLHGQARGHKGFRGGVDVRSAGGSQRTCGIQDPMEAQSDAPPVEKGQRLCGHSRISAAGRLEISALALRAPASSFKRRRASQSAYSMPRLSTSSFGRRSSRNRSLRLTIGIGPGKRRPPPRSPGLARRGADVGNRCPIRGQTPADVPGPSVGPSGRRSERLSHVPALVRIVTVVCKGGRARFGEAHLDRPSDDGPEGWRRP